MNRLFLSAMALTAALAAAPASAAISEDFESSYGVFTPTTKSVYRANGNTYSGCCGTNPNDLNYFVALGGGSQPSGLLSSSFATLAGTVYRVAFDYGALGGGPETLTVTAGGVTRSYDTVASANPINYTRAFFDFVGTGSATTISFTSSGGPSVDAIIDNVSVSGVPEPASWALMMLGIGAIGFTMRRRAKVRTAITFA